MLNDKGLAISNLFRSTNRRRVFSHLSRARVSTNGESLRGRVPEIRTECGTALYDLKLLRPRRAAEIGRRTEAGI